MKTYNKSRELVFFFSIFTLAFLLRSYGLYSLPLAEDSLYTLRDSINLGSSIKPVYYFIQHVLLNIFPTTAFTLRFPAFLFGLLGIWVTWIFVKREFGLTAAVIATLMVAVSPWHLYASQFARYWTLVYLLSAMLYIFLFKALDSNRVKYYLSAFFVTCIGILTHMSFAFPLPGIFVALLVKKSNETFTLKLPAKSAWWYYWFPSLIFAVIVAGLYLFLEKSGTAGGVKIPSGYKMVGTIRVLPAMIQWVSPVVVTTAFLGAIYLICTSKSESIRRLGFMCIFASLSLIIFLFIPGALLRAVYADYGMAILPLLYATIGVSVSVLSRQLPNKNMSVIAILFVLLAGVLPGTVSHMSDGSRFDYRPTFDFISKNGSQHLVLGKPKDMQQFYAPELFFVELSMNENFLNDKLKLFNNFWLISLYRRHGMIGDNNGSVQRWIDLNCRVVLRTKKQRIDYRLYRVELSWCGTSTY